MPALLSLDNLTAGLPGASAPALALTSGVAAMGGLTAGWSLGRGVRIGAAALRGA